MHKKDLKIIERFKELVSKKVKVHELRVFGSRAREGFRCTGGFAEANKCII